MTAWVLASSPWPEDFDSLFMDVRSCLSIHHTLHVGAGLLLVVIFLYRTGKVNRSLLPGPESVAGLTWFVLLMDI